jgi:ubiquinone/menaquinone biosynthesis C-methylase UbiE
MSFDALAPHYRWMEALLAQEKLQRCRVEFLEAVAGSDPQTILLVGEGPGRFLLECCRRLPSARLICVDSSKRMLLAASERLERFGMDARNVEFVHSDLFDWQAPAGQVDLLVTHFFLDCFRADQLQRVVARLSRWARPEASWLLADFQRPSNGFPALRARVILKLMYAFFRLVTSLPARTLTSPDRFLVDQGFRLAARVEKDWGLLRSDLWKRQL